MMDTEFASESPQREEPAGQQGYEKAARIITAVVRTGKKQKLLTEMILAYDHARYYELLVKQTARYTALAQEVRMHDRFLGTERYLLARQAGKEISSYLVSICKMINEPAYSWNKPELSVPALLARDVAAIGKSLDGLITNAKEST